MATAREAQFELEIPGEFGILEEVVELVVGMSVNAALNFLRSLTGVDRRKASRKRFAVVDLQTDTVIKFISARKALLLTQRRRRPRRTKKEIHIIKADGCTEIIK